MTTVHVHLLMAKEVQIAEKQPSRSEILISVLACHSILSHLLLVANQNSIDRLIVARTVILASACKAIS